MLDESRATILFSPKLCHQGEANERLVQVTWRSALHSTGFGFVKCSALNTFALRAFALVLCLNLFLNFMLKHLYPSFFQVLLCAWQRSYWHAWSSRTCYSNRWEILGLTQRVMRSTCQVAVVRTCCLLLVQLLLHLLAFASAFSQRDHFCIPLRSFEWSYHALVFSIFSVKNSLILYFLCLIKV